MKKISAQVKKLTELLGKKLDAEKAKKLDEVQTEDDLTEFLDELLNHVPEYEKEKLGKGREKVWEDLDSKILADTELESLLGKEKFDKIKGMKGTDKHVQLSAAYKEAIKAAKEAKASAETPAEAKAYQEQIKKLQEEAESLKASGAEALKAKETELTNKYEAEILSERLYNLVMTDGGLADSYRNEKFVKRMVVNEMFDKAKEKGLKFNGTKLTKEDGSPLFVSGGNEYQIKDLLGEVVSEDWKKKADTTTTTTVSVDGNKNKGGYMPADPVASAMGKSMLAE